MLSKYLKKFSKLLIIFLNKIFLLFPLFWLEVGVTSVSSEDFITSWYNLLDSYFSIIIESLTSLKFLEIKICGKLPLLYLIKVSMLTLFL